MAAGHPDSPRSRSGSSTRYVPEEAGGQTWFSGEGGPPHFCCCRRPGLTFPFSSTKSICTLSPSTRLPVTCPAFQPFSLSGNQTRVSGASASTSWLLSAILSGSGGSSWTRLVSVYPESVKVCPSLSVREVESTSRVQEPTNPERRDSLLSTLHRTGLAVDCSASRATIRWASFSRCPVGPARRPLATLRPAQACRSHRSRQRYVPPTARDRIPPLARSLVHMRDRYSTRLSCFSTSRPGDRGVHLAVMVCSPLHASPRGLKIHESLSS